MHEETRNLQLFLQPKKWDLKQVNSLGSTDQLVVRLN